MPFSRPIRSVTNCPSTTSDGRCGSDWTSTGRVHWPTAQTELAAFPTQHRRGGALMMGLLARRKNFRRGFARIRADTRGLRPVPRGSAGRPPKIFFGGLRRTSGERSADTGGLRADTGGSARSPRRTGGRVHSKNVRRQ